MDSKYSLLNKNGHIPKFQIKRKPTPIIFNNKNGSSPKKVKFPENHSPMNGTNQSNGTNGRNRLTIQEQKRNLPIFEKRNKLLELIQRHNTLIILGETGSGKTTQIPQYINSARLQGNGKIAITQPRRISAISVAMRVTQEMSNGVIF